ncbi:hypothetical protein [Corynebacterium caspium]|uniref:hypothetical protein n=1 Tax=Corynebacterium caspium TaxID=234828 RepID=UPI000381F012|nr:hypothetical protein [Corynebacterium caspium]WKD58800.1 hypothetical protein CCASP_01925 [Corynebacterium caspium DSM 44850]
MDLIIDTDSIELVNEELKRLTSLSGSSETRLTSHGLSGAFSAISGLDQLGSAHGAVLNGDEGSALKAVTAVAKQIYWILTNLDSNMCLINAHNSAFSLGLNAVGGNSATSTVTGRFNIRPNPEIQSFSFTPPLIHPPLSITELVSGFATTNILASGAALEAWQVVAKSMSGVSPGLAAIAGELTTNNQGNLFIKAAEKLLELSQITAHISANATYMATTIIGLQAAQTQGQIMANSMQASLTPIVTPAERISAEKALTAAWPVLFQTLITPAIPIIKNLGHPLPPGLSTGGSTQAIMNPETTKTFQEVLQHMPPTARHSLDTALKQATASTAPTGSFNAVNQGSQPVVGLEGLTTEKASAANLGFSSPLEQLKPLLGQSTTPASASQWLSSNSLTGNGIPLNKPPLGGSATGQYSAGTSSSISSRGTLHGGNPERNYANNSTPMRANANPISASSTSGTSGNSGTSGLNTNSSMNNGANSTGAAASSTTNAAARSNNMQAASTNAASRGTKKLKKGQPMHRIATTTERSGNLLKLLGPEEPLIEGVIGAKR